MRNAVIVVSGCLFFLSTLVGSWVIPVPSSATDADHWELLSFRDAFGLGLRSYSFSVPVILACYAFRRHIWPTPLTPATAFGNLTVLVILGLILGRVNLATH